MAGRPVLSLRRRDELICPLPAPGDGTGAPFPRKTPLAKHKGRSEAAAVLRRGDWIDSALGFHAEIVVAAFAQSDLVAFDPGDLAHRHVVMLAVNHIRAG